MSAITDKKAHDNVTLHLLRQAVQAKLTYWDANGALEAHLGFPGGCNDEHRNPDAACDAIEDEISQLASTYPESQLPGMQAVIDEHVQQLLEAIEKTS